MGGTDGRVGPAIIALMAKAPLVGETKTRLATLLGADAAAELSAQFLADTLATARQVPGATVWIVCPDERHRRALAGLVPGGVDVLAQPEPGLMAGLGWAFGAGFAAGAAKVLLIDADSPTRPAELFGEALRRLEQADLCIGPSPDGGYHLIGVRRFCPGLFDSIAASTGDTYSQTIARAGALGLSTTVLPRWRDVDTPEDLRALVAELGARRNGAPATRAWLERSGWLRATPQELYLEVTNRCNSRCLTCPLTWGGQEPEHDLRYGAFLALIDELPALRRVVLHGIGEPLLNRDLPGMIAELKRRGVTVLFNTNGIGLGPRLRRQLVESGLDELRISLDAGRRESYRRIRGVDAFDRVLANADALARLQRELGRKSPRLSLWFTGMHDNIAELPDLIRAAARAGVAGVHLQRLVYRGVGLAVAEQAIYDAGDRSPNYR